MSCKYFYTKETNKWLIEHKNMSSKELLKAFTSHFYSYEGLTTDALKYHIKHIESYKTITNNNYTKELYTETKRGDNIFIKVGQSNIWMLKSKWVYMETHPEELADIKPSDVYIFLDDDKNNFSYENVVRLPKGILTVCNRYGGLKGLSPEQKKIVISRAFLSIKILDAADKAGLAYNTSGSRMLKSKVKENSKRRTLLFKNNKEFREHRRELYRKYYASRTPEKIEHKKAYMHEYNKRRAEQKKAEKAAQIDAQGTTCVN